MMDTRFDLMLAYLKDCAQRHEATLKRIDEVSVNDGHKAGLSTVYLNKVEAVEKAITDLYEEGMALAMTARIADQMNAKRLERSADGLSELLKSTGSLN